MTSPAHDKEWKVIKDTFYGTAFTDKNENGKWIIPKSLLDQIRRDAKKELLDELEKLFFAVNDKGINGQRRLYEQHLVEFRVKTLGEQVKKE